MSNSTLAVGAFLIMFFVYVTVKGRLPVYRQIFGI